MPNGVIKYKELKKNVRYAIPCKRDDGSEDYATISVFEQNGRDEIWLNTRFMGASPKRFTKKEGDWRFVIKR